LKSGTSITYDNTLWEYDPTIGTDGQWNQKPSFAGLQRGTAGAFTINNVGYVTGGLDFTPGTGVAYRDLWSYNPTTQQWTLVNTYPSIMVPPNILSWIVEGFSVGNKGYIIGAGYFLEFDPIQNLFTSKGIPSSSNHQGSTALNLCNLGMLVTGATQTVTSKNVYKYLSTELDFTGPSTVCNTSTTFTANTVATGSNIIWTTSSNLTYVSGQGSRSYTTRASSIGSGWIRMDVTTPCGNSYYMQHNVWAGSANNSAGLTVSGSATPAPGGLYNYRLLGLLPAEEGPFTYTWRIPSGNGWSFFSQNLNTTSVDVWVGTTEGSVEAYWSNGCGQTGTYLWVTTYHSGGGGGGGGPGPLPGPGPQPEIVISPNPSTTTVTIKATESLNRSALDQPYQLFLADKYGRKVFSVQSDEKNFDIPVSHLPEDIYYLNLIYKDVMVRKQIVIKR